MTEEKQTCGDYGGKNQRTGEPCGRPAGWGTDQEEGRCKGHVASKNQALKKEFIEKLESKVIPISKAASEIGRDHSTIWGWRQEDEEFDEQVKEAKEKQKTMRSERAKDAVFERVISGKGSASERIFWLKNNTDWGDGPEVEINNQMEQMQRQDVDIDELSDILSEGVEDVRNDKDFQNQVQKKQQE